MHAYVHVCVHPRVLCVSLGMHGMHRCEKWAWWARLIPAIGSDEHDTGGDSKYFDTLTPQGSQHPTY